MKTFRTLYKIELKLSLRGMDMVIFAVCLPVVMGVPMIVVMGVFLVLVLMVMGMGMAMVVVLAVRLLIQG